MTTEDVKKRLSDLHDKLVNQLTKRAIDKRGLEHYSDASLYDQAAEVITHLRAKVAIFEAEREQIYKILKVTKR